MPLLLLFVYLVLAGVVLAVFLWVGATFVQGTLYNDPAPGLFWRAPAAGAAIAAFLAVWCLVNYRLGEPGADDVPFGTWWSFSPNETYPAKPWKEFRSVKNGKETLYVRRPTVARGGVTQYQYVDPTTNQPWSRESGGIVQAIVVDDNGQTTRFNLEALPGGKFKPGELARYAEDGGRHRVLTEDDVQRGQLTHFRSGLFYGYVLLNLLHLAVWFVCLWLLLRFQWPHALGLAVVLWVAGTLALLTPLTYQTKQAVDAKPAVRPTAALVPARA
jgi:hypothetical protein